MGRCGMISAAVGFRLVTVGGATAAIRARGKGRSIYERIGTGQAAAKQFRLVAGMEIMADLARMPTDMFLVEIQGAIAEAGCSALPVGDAVAVMTAETEPVHVLLERHVQAVRKGAEQQFPVVSAMDRVALAAFAGSDRPMYGGAGGKFLVMALETDKVFPFEQFGRTRLVGLMAGNALAGGDRFVGEFPAVEQGAFVAEITELAAIPLQQVAGG